MRRWGGHSPDKRRHQSPPLSSILLSLLAEWFCSQPLINNPPLPLPPPLGNRLLQKSPNQQEGAVGRCPPDVCFRVELKPDARKAFWLEDF